MGTFICQIYITREAFCSQRDEAFLLFSNWTDDTIALLQTLGVSHSI